MSDKRQKNQLVLAFTEEERSEAPKASQEGTESLTAKCETERPASHEQLMEEVCERENCWQAYKRVKANKGSPGIDGMKVGELSGYLKQHWPSIREQLLRGTYQPQPVRRVEIPKPDGGMRKLGIPTVLDRLIQQAVMQVLQRRWDPTFSEHSHGFRPKRSAHQGAVVSPLLANVYLHYAFDLWAQHWRKHRATGDVIIVRYADDIVMGFEQRADAERFLQEWKERLRKFGLELHPDKTRLIEFGRFAAEDRKRRGEGKPETFNFLGFTHICAKNQKTGGFSVDRKTIRKRLSAKLKAVREELRRRWHEPVAEVGKWLRSVVQGYFNYHAVPGNIDRLQSFRAQVVWHWSRALQRRSQKSRMPWERFGPLVARWIPSATILHPRPAMRFNARYLR